MVYLRELIGKKFKPLYKKAYEKDGKYTIKVSVDGKEEFVNLTQNEYKFYFEKGVDTNSEYEVYKNAKGYPAIKKAGSGKKATSSSQKPTYQRQNNKPKVTESAKKALALQIIAIFENTVKQDLKRKLRIDDEVIEDILNKIEIKYVG